MNYNVFARNEFPSSSYVLTFFLSSLSTIYYYYLSNIFNFFGCKKMLREEIINSNWCNVYWFNVFNIPKLKELHGYIGQKIRFSKINGKNIKTTLVLLHNSINLFKKKLIWHKNKRIRRKKFQTYKFLCGKLVEYQSNKISYY